MNQLEGKTALVTGGARGLGKCICEVLAKDRMNIVVTDSNYQAAQQTAQQLRQNGFSAQEYKLDVQNIEDIDQAIESVQLEFGTLEVLINNAGYDITTSILDLTASDWDRIINTNLRGPFLISQAALRTMSMKKSGYIVNIVSTAAKRAWPNAAAYHASKWGLLGFSHALFTEAREFSVKVSAVICGGMRTPFLLDRFPEIDPQNLQDPIHVAEVIRYLLLQPKDLVIPELMVIPMQETSWP